MGTAGRRDDVTVTLPWMREGTAFLLAAVDRLDDGQLAEPSGLPGWSRAHVVGHLARNAEALGRLVAWARTGVETPMYASRSERAAEIEVSATLPADRLRDDLVRTAAELDEALDALDDAGRRARVRSALGRDMPASDIPWMRIREVWLHAVDLAAGAVVADLPVGVVDLLLDDASGFLSGRDGCPAVTLEPTDRDRRWVLGPDDAVPVVVTGSATDVLGWLVGRADGSLLTVRRPGADVALPKLPTWL